MIMAMIDELTIRIAGEAGQGMQTVGQALCIIFRKAGFMVFANQDYMSRIRGGNNFFQLRIAAKPLYTLRAFSDIVVALDSRSVDIHLGSLREGGVMVLDKKKFGIAKEDARFFDVPLSKLAAGSGTKRIYDNSAACGVLAVLTGVDFDYVQQGLELVFSGKPAEVIHENIAAARAGFEFARQSPGQNALRLNGSAAKSRTYLMNGHDAVVLGAIRAGCKFYSGYPMTPSTSVLEGLAHYAGQFNIVVEQAEDEIAGINMALGASFAGARAMTGTSGGGFALMAEGVSLAGMTETPVVIVVAQRPGPATGFPTRTEQADLNFIIHSGHGEFARVVYAPGSIEQAFSLTVKAFNAAEKYQIPVFILTDQHLADSYRDVAMPDFAGLKARRYIISREDSGKISGYKRYQLTESGISPRAIPSWINEPFYADSDEHTEEGHITEDAKMRAAMVEKRFYKKMAALEQEVEPPETANLDGAEAVLVGFGSTYGAMKEVSESFKGKKIGFVHLSQVWPFPSKEITRILGGAQKAITVENNAGAQLAGLIRRETGIKVYSSLLKYDGRPFDLDYLTQRIIQEV